MAAIIHSKMVIPMMHATKSAIFDGIDLRANAELFSC